MYSYFSPYQFYRQLEAILQLTCVCLLELDMFPRHVRRHRNHIDSFDKFVKCGRFCDNNSKFHLLLYVEQRNVATAVLV